MTNESQRNHAELAGKSRGHARLRNLLLTLLAVAMLAAIGAGGTIAARRYADHNHVSVSAPVAYVTELAPIVRQGDPHTPPPAPKPVSSCSCTPQHETVPVPTYGVPSGAGQEVLVSISQQWLWAYQNGKLVMATPVTTGMPQLPTPTGTFSIMSKESNVWFYSPWPQGSPYYYTPEYVQYAMLFRSGGFYLHSAGWRQMFGPGSNVPHTLPDGSTETGSHGCVNLPVEASGALYGWINVGATVIIQN